MATLAEDHIRATQVIGQLQEQIKKHEVNFLGFLEALDECDTEEDHRIACQAIKKICEQNLKALRKGKWIIRARCEDGTCYYNQGTWDTAWYGAACFDSEAEAQAVIEKIKSIPSDEIMGSFKAVQL